MYMGHWCEKSRLMRAVTSGISTGGSVALALKLLSWADKAEQIVPFNLSHWSLDTTSYLLGLLSGILLFFVIELRCVCKWCAIAWVERRQKRVAIEQRPLRKPLYKLC